MIARTRMLKAAAAALACGIFLASAHAGQPVQLRPDVQASGPALTLGDVFVDAGPASGRAVAPAPRPGEHTSISARFVAAAAAAAGLAWTPPDGLDTIDVTGHGSEASATARRQYAALTPVNAMRSGAPITTSAAASAAVADALIHRGELVTLVYVAPGLQLTTRAKALADAGMGEAIRVVNLQSNRIVDATVSGPDAASASPGPSF